MMSKKPPKGETLGRMLRRAREEIERMRQQLRDASQIIVDQNRARDAIQARLDEVMLEYCPDEMTCEQKANWAKHQAPADFKDPV